METLADFGIHPTIARLRDQWEGELRGRLKPSHASLLTPINLSWGRECRSQLETFWRKQGLIG
jgi:hypothetical protein